MPRKHYPSIWKRVFTDGSAKKANNMGGSGTYITHLSGNTEAYSIAAWQTCTNFRARAAAPDVAIKTLNSRFELTKEKLYLMESV